MNKENIIWLAGFWDGEGSITIFKHKEKNGKWKICPTLAIVNTDLNTINHIIHILDNLGTSFHIFEKKVKKEHKTCYQLNTRNIKYIKIVLDAISPFLITKKAQAELVLRYVNKKLEQMKDNKRPRYDDEDFELQQLTQRLNRRGAVSEPSETIGETSKKDDIVQTATAQAGLGN